MNSNIYDYSDFRSYLRDHALAQKQGDPNWSYGRWAKKLKVANTAVIANIINGVRNPGPKVLNELIKYFAFPQSEAKYFKNLVRLAKKQDDPELANILMTQLKDAHPEHTFRLLDDNVFQSISRPHYYAIREMLNLKDFKEDISWIHNRLEMKVSKPDIKRALSNMLQLGLLSRNAQGKLQYHAGSVRSSNEIVNEALRQFHEGMISFANDAIRKVAVSERDITSMTFAAKKSDLPQIKKDIAHFRRSLMKKYECLGQGDHVYQLNIQFVPLTSENSKKSGDKDA